MWCASLDLRKGLVVLHTMPGLMLWGSLWRFQNYNVIVSWPGRIGTRTTISNQTRCQTRRRSKPIRVHIIPLWNMQWKNGTCVCDVLTLMLRNRHGPAYYHTFWCYATDMVRQIITHAWQFALKMARHIFTHVWWTWLTRCRRALRNVQHIFSARRLGRVQKILLYTRVALMRGRPCRC